MTIASEYFDDDYGALDLSESTPTVLTPAQARATMERAGWDRATIGMALSKPRISRFKIGEREYRIEG